MLDGLFKWNIIILFLFILIFNYVWILGVLGGMGILFLNGDNFGYLNIFVN